MNTLGRQFIRFIGLLSLALLLPAANFVWSQVADLGEIGGDMRRALIVELLIGEDGTATLEKAFVADVPPGTYAADPPLLGLDYLDAAGNVLISRNAWDPRWEFTESDEGGEARVLSPSAAGAFGVVFRSDIATVRVVDKQHTPPFTMLEADLQSVILQFCSDNPQHPECVQDEDGDGIADHEDNCPTVANYSQENLDNDDYGDACDPDDDNDLVTDDTDLCPGTAPSVEVDAYGCSADQRDTDGDGIADANDSCPGTAPGDQVDVSGCSAAQRDADGDGVADAEDSCPATPIGTEVDVAGCPLSQGGGICDVDLDNDVDRADIWRIIFSRNRRNLDPDDPRDANGNGRVDFWDVVLCTRECDRNFCATR